MKSIDLIGWMWPAEVAVIVAFALGGSVWVPPERYELFLRGLPLLTALIGAQGGAVYFGKAQG